MDDGESYDYQSGAYISLVFEYEDGVLTSKNLHPEPDSEAAKAFRSQMHQVRIERLYILGATKQPKKVQVVASRDDDASPLTFDYDATKAKITVKDPKVSITEHGWKVIVLS